MAIGLALHQRDWNAVMDMPQVRESQLSAQDPRARIWNVGLDSDEQVELVILYPHWQLISRRGVNCVEFMRRASHQNQLHRGALAGGTAASKQEWLNCEEDLELGS